MLGFLVLAAVAGEEEECFSELVPLQSEGLEACETAFLTAQGRGSKLVTEDWKPVGSGRFRVPSQDSSWVLGTSCSSSFSLRQEPGLGSSSSRNNLTALTSQTDPLSHQDTTLSAHGLRNEMHLSRKMARDRSSLQAWFLQLQRNFSHVTRKQAM